MALTRNYANLGMWSPRAIERRHQQDNKIAKQIAWVKKFIADGGSHLHAAAAYRKHLADIEKTRKANYKNWKRAKHDARKNKSKRAKQPTPHVAVPQKPREEVRPHYRAGMSSKDFYRCWEWQTLRYQILRELGALCMCCGAAGNHVDHIKPRSKFPALELDRTNLQILCESCNVGKSNLYEDDWRKTGPSSSPA